MKDPSTRPTATSIVAISHHEPKLIVDDNRDQLILTEQILYKMLGKNTQQEVNKWIKLTRPFLT